MLVFVILGLTIIVLENKSLECVSFQTFRKLVSKHSKVSKRYLTNTVSLENSY